MTDRPQPKRGEVWWVKPGKTAGAEMDDITAALAIVVEYEWEGSSTRRRGYASHEGSRMAAGERMIIVPTAEDLARANAEFDRDWGGVDDVLTDLCRRHPGHTDRRSVTAKVALIGRAYSAGFERRVTPPKGQQAIVVIADYFERHGAQVDEILAPLHPIDEPLSLQGMATIVGVHGRFTQLLVGVTTDGKSPRSFASKYLHFHNPAVPIYDSYALAGIRRLVRWDAAEIPFGCPPGGDDVADGYYQFCVRFWRLLEACRNADRDVSVKSLDTYLWSVPTSS